MRRIEREMVTAIRGRFPWRKDNTEVSVIEGDPILGYPCIYVYLHGNCIAEIRPDRYEFSDCGWSTPTTRSRLNAVFHALDLPWQLYQRRWQQYIAMPGRAEPFDGYLVYRLDASTVDEWCAANGFTEPFRQEGRWWAYPINGAMPVQIDYYGLG